MISKRKAPQPKAAWTRAFPAQHAALTPAVRKFHPTRAITAARKRRSDRLYKEICVDFFADPANQYDRIELALTGAKIPANHVHHIRGRHLTLKFDMRFFCPTSAKNDLWPHNNIAAARKLGLIAEAGDWNREPHDQETLRLRDLMLEKGIL